MKIVDIEKWAPHVGIFMLEFGAIESLTLGILKELTADPVYKHIKEISLGKKIQLITDLLMNLENDKDLNRELIDVFREIEQLTRIRNVIAHNTVKLIFWTNAEPDDKPFEEAIYNEKNEKTITLYELKKHREQLSKLVQTLYKIDAAKRGRRINNHLESLKITGLSFHDSEKNDD